MKTNKTRFLHDDSARVPFVVIGIFLVILSTLISLNLTRMDIKMAKTMSSNIEISAPDQALAYAKADLERALNYAAMEALKNLVKRLLSTLITQASITTEQTVILINSI